MASPGAPWVDGWCGWSDRRCRVLVCVVLPVLILLTVVIALLLRP